MKNNGPWCDRGYKGSRLVSMGIGAFVCHTNEQKLF